MVEVLIIAGSESDRALADKAAESLKEFGVSSAIEIASAHRNPKKLEALVESSEAKVFIAIAGLSAALPGVIASKTARPVIGVPANVKLDGLDALLSMMQLPSGVPVATVGIDNAKNAALLAVQILSVSSPQLQKKLADFKKSLAK